jgi:hypothetical protein
VTTLPVAWAPCTHQGHLDDLRVRHEDVGAHPSDRDAQTALWRAVETLLDHLDGKHRDDSRVWALTPLDELKLRGSGARAVQEPNRYGARAHGGLGMTAMLIAQLFVGLVAMTAAGSMIVTGWSQGTALSRRRRR